MLEREKIDISQDRKLLGQLIMDSTLLGSVVVVGRPELFDSVITKTVAQWVWDYYLRVGEAPGRAIIDVYAQRSAELQPADQQLIYDFLSHCSEEWAPTNTKFAQGVAEKFFRKRALAQLAEQLQRACAVDDPSVGEKLIADYSKPEVHTSSLVSILHDTRKIANSFNEEENSVFVLPYQLGEMAGGFIATDFITFLAPPKRGKTWWLIASALSAFIQGQNVLFISLEMPEEQVIRRFWQGLTGCSRWGETVPWPVFVQDGNQYYIEDQQRKTTKVDTSIASISKLQETLGKISGGGDLRIATYPTDTLTVSKLRSDLKTMEVFDNFVPTVICLDYPDIMRHEKGNDERDRINNTWKGLRGLAQERKCVLIVASQTGRQTMGGTRDAGDEDVAEDIRKIAHCTKSIRINQTDEEKERGIYRLSCKVTRDSRVVPDQVVCTNCLDIGRPYLEMRWLREIAVPQDDEEETPRRHSRR